MIYLTGCTHFDHGNIIKYANRPFKDVDEMNETLVNNWNKRVNKNDTVYHLGDFCFKYNKIDYWRSRLNGTIIQIKGNHDPKNTGTIYREINHGKKKVVLFHYPIDEWNGYYRGAYHFHCHTHEHKFVTGENRGNVTVEACNYTPISLDRAIEKLS